MMKPSFEQFNEECGTLEGAELVAAIAKKTAKEQRVLLSAFNPEDVILAKWLSDLAPDTPILFLDTQKHFPETLRYVDEVVTMLGLQDVRTLTPDPKLLHNSDPNGSLWQVQVNRCCWLRKVEPLERELERGQFSVLITGRRQEQTPERSDMKAVEQDEQGRIKVNPLYKWTRQQRDDAMRQLGLPFHPLYDLGYLSMGCAPCTTPIFQGEDERAGRWRHTKLSTEDSQQGKTECGLHVNTGGQI